MGCCVSTCSNCNHPGHRNGQCPVTTENPIYETVMVEVSVPEYKTVTKTRRVRKCPKVKKEEKYIYYAQKSRIVTRTQPDTEKVYKTKQRPVYRWVHDYTRGYGQNVFSGYETYTEPEYKPITRTVNETVYDQVPEERTRTIEVDDVENAYYINEDYTEQELVRHVKKMVPQRQKTKRTEMVQCTCRTL
jgi:hypothetical protein